MSDSISRQSAIDELIAMREHIDAEMSVIGCKAYEMAIEALREPEPKKGKWIRTRTMEHDGELYCDQCGQEHPEQKLIWKFCPNCGVRMVKEGNTE